MQPSTTIYFFGNAVFDYELIISAKKEDWQSIVKCCEQDKKQYADESDERSFVLYNKNETSIFRTYFPQNEFDLSKVEWRRPYEDDDNYKDKKNRWSWLVSLRGQSRQTEQVQQCAACSPEIHDRTEWSLHNGITRPKDIRQGKLADCWFLAAASLIMNHREIFDRIFPTYVFQPSGAYFICLCVDGQWDGYIVDDRAPSYEGNFLFASSKNKQLWPLLLEKAMAKAYGCYEALEKGLPSEALSALTGQPVETLGLSSDQQSKQNFWGSFRRFLKDEKFFICANSKRSDDQSLDNTLEFVGLVPLHVYAVVDIFEECNTSGKLQLQLVRLQNPWGESAWNGRWHDCDSESWQNRPDLEKKLDPTHQDNGSFWMSYDDFLKYFHSIEVCKLRFHWHEKRFTAPFYRPYYANNRKITVRTRVGIMPFTIKKRMKVEFMLHQTGLRKKKPAERMSIDLNMFVCSVTKHTNGNTGRPIDLICNSQRNQSNSLVSTVAEFEPGDYALLPLSFSLLANPDNGNEDTPIGSYTLSAHYPDHTAIHVVNTTAELVSNTFIRQVLNKYMLQRCKRNPCINGDRGQLSYYETEKLSGVSLLMLENESDQRQLFFAKGPCRTSETWLRLFGHAPSSDDCVEWETYDLLPEKTQKIVQMTLTSQKELESFQYRVDIMVNGEDLCLDELPKVTNDCCYKFMFSAEEINS